jgi:hypothetical protein
MSTANTPDAAGSPPTQIRSLLMCRTSHTAQARRNIVMHTSMAIARKLVIRAETCINIRNYLLVRSGAVATLHAHHLLCVAEPSCSTLEPSFTVNCSHSACSNWCSTVLPRWAPWSNRRAHAPRGLRCRCAHWSVRCNCAQACPFGRRVQSIWCPRVADGGAIL